MTSHQDIDRGSLFSNLSAEAQHARRYVLRCAINLIVPITFSIWMLDIQEDFVSTSYAKLDKGSELVIIWREKRLISNQ